MSNEKAQKVSATMSFRKNATTLVIKNPRRLGSKRSEGGTHIVRAMVPRRQQRSFLHQADVVRGPEKKNIDIFTTFAPPLASAFSAFQHLNPCAQGTASSERVGRKILMKSVQWRGIFHTSNSEPASQHRVVVIYDKQPNGALPSVSDVFSGGTFVSPMNLVYADRFVVVHDEITDSSQSSALNISDKRFTKVNLEALYSGTGGTISANTSGSLLMSVSNNAGTITGTVTAVDMYTRVRYIDN